MSEFDVGVRRDCYTCFQGERPDAPIRESVWRRGGWRVALSFNSSLPGWAVVVPSRHVEALDQLSTVEADALGPLLRDVSTALGRVTSCVKTYVILFAEADGFSHLHFHVVPRGRDMPEDRRGTGVFAYLRDEPLTEERRDAIATALRRELEEPAS